jgi:hypothetical protein
MAVGFVTLASRWKAGEGRRILDTLYQANETATLILARTADQQEQICLAGSGMGENAELAAKGAIRATESLQQALAQNGVEALRVADELGVEQLYWLCVLGKAFHEDAELRSEGRLVAARVAANPLRLLTTFELRTQAFERSDGDASLPGLLRLTESRRPFFLAIALKPVPPERVAQWLQRLAAKAPEMTLLAEALGEDAATQGYVQFQSSAMAEAVLLLRGRKEGLWQTGYRLICLLADAPLLTDRLTITPYLLGPRGFVETATIQPSSLGHSISTAALLTLIGQRKRRRALARGRARRAQEERGAEAT